METLVQRIIIQIKANLSVTTIEGQDISKAIEEEVLSLVRSGQVIEDIETVVRLERRIVERLSEKRNVQVTAHRKTSSADEWDVLARYAAHLQKEEERSKAVEAVDRIQRAQVELMEQKAATAQRKKREDEIKQAELKRVEAEVRAWRQTEEVKRAARRIASNTLMKDRQAQMKETKRRQDVARLLRQAADAHAADEAREMARRDAEKDIIARAAARRELEAVFEGNKTAQRARAEAQRAEQELDRRYMVQYSEKLARQDAERVAQLEKVRAVQAAQAEDAATRPPFKIWIADEIVEQQAALAEARAAAKEAEKNAAAAAAVKRTAAEIAAQLHDHQMARAAEAEEKASELAAATAMAVAVAAEETQRAQRTAETKRKFKNALDEQVHVRTVNRPRAGMNAAEKKINARLLKKAVAALPAKQQQQHRSRTTAAA